LGFGVSSGDVSVPAYAGRVDISNAQAVGPTTPAVTPAPPPSSGVAVTPPAGLKGQ
jgi:hypothetical protein